MRIGSLLPGTVAIYLLLLSLSVFAQDPSNYEGWYQRGEDLVDEDELEQAVTAFQNALKLKPKYFPRYGTTLDVSPPMPFRETGGQCSITYSGKFVDI